MIRAYLAADQKGDEQQLHPARQLEAARDQLFLNLEATPVASGTQIADSAEQTNQ